MPHKDKEPETLKKLLEGEKIRAQIANKTKTKQVEELKYLTQEGDFSDPEVVRRTEELLARLEIN